MEIRWRFFPIIVLIKWRLLQLYQLVETFTLCIAWSFICVQGSATIKYFVTETFHCFCIDEMYFSKQTWPSSLNCCLLFHVSKHTVHHIKFSITVYLTQLFFHLSQDLPELEEVEIVPVTPAGVSSLSPSLFSVSLSMCVSLSLPGSYY